MKQKGGRRAPEGGGTGGKPRPAAAPGNPFLEALLRECRSGGARMRKEAVAYLDTILGDPPSLEQLTGHGRDEFAHILDVFSDGIRGDESRPVFRGDPRCIRDRTGMKMGHLLLLSLMDSRGGPVLDGMAAIFGMDRGTAGQYLRYGKSVLQKVPDTPDKLAADLMDLLRGGRYGEIERRAPGLELYITLQELSSGQLAAGRHGTDPGVPDELYDLLLVRTRTTLIIGFFASPRDGAGGAGLFRRYLEDEGAYLVDLTRRLPDGRRWTVRYAAGLEGIEGLLPGVDVGPAADPRADADPFRLFSGGGARQSEDPGPSGTDPEPARGPPEPRGPAGLVPPGDLHRIEMELTCGTGMLEMLELEPGDDGQMILDGRVPAHGIEPTAGGAMIAVLFQLRGSMTLGKMEEFYKMDKGAALAEVGRAMDHLYDSLSTKPADITDELGSGPGIRGGRLYFGCITVPLSGKGRHEKALFAADETGRIVGLGDAVDGDADRRGMIRGYLAGRGRQLARLMESRGDGLTVYAGSRLVELADELPGNTVKRYRAPGILERVLDVFDDYTILGVGYDHEWYNLDRTLQVLSGMVNIRMILPAGGAGP